MEPWFQRNYKPVKAWGPVDIVILPVPGFALHNQFQNLITFLQTLKPRAMFPLYAGTEEHYYSQFAQKIQKHNIDTKIYYAEQSGQHFNYK